jgi:hypothetical protein
MSTSDKIALTTRRVERRPCLLCGGRPYLVGLFVPHKDSQHWVNAPIGKVRAVAYTLCQACARAENVQAKVEAKIFAEVGGLNPGASP